MQTKMPTSKFKLLKSLSGIQSDMELFFQRVNDSNDCDTSYVMLCQVRIFTQLKTLIPDLRLWLSDKTSHSGAPSTALNCVSRYLNMLRSELRILPNWAVWSRNERSLTFLYIDIKGNVPSVRNTVILEFHSNASHKWVTFFCIPSVLGVKLRFKVSPDQLVNRVIALLKSFQSTKVVTRKLLAEEHASEKEAIKPEVGGNNGVDIAPGKVEGDSDYVLHSTDGNRGDDSTSMPSTTILNNLPSDQTNGIRLSMFKSESDEQNSPETFPNESNQIPECEDVAESLEDNGRALNCEEVMKSGERVNDETEEPEPEDSDEDCEEEADKNDKDFVAWYEKSSYWEKAAKTERQNGEEAGEKKEELVRRSWYRHNPCRLCNKVVRNDTVSKHLLKEHDIKDMVCCYCPKFFDTKEHRSLHVSMNHPPRKSPRPYCLECKECSIPITKNESFEHMYIEHKRKDECSFCDFKLENFDVSKMDMKDIVDKNDMSLSSLERFKRHILRSHRFKEKVNKCSYCRKRFETVELCRQHKNKKLDPSLREVPLCSRLPDNKKTLCNLCGKSVTSSGLRNHLAASHDVERDKTFRFKCSYCDKTYSSSTNFKNHLLHHHLAPKTKSKPECACDICGQKYPSRDSLRKHMVSHNVANVECPRCDKTFKRKGHLIQHMRGVHYPPQYECLRCNQRFHHRVVVRQHLNKEHDITDVDGHIERRTIVYEESDRKHLDRLKFT